MKKRFPNRKYESLELTEEERKAVEAYSGIFHEVVNNALEPGIENEKAFHKTLGMQKYDEDSIKRMIMVIPNLYSALYKNAINRGDFGKYDSVYRGTNVQDVERLKEQGQSFRFTSTTYDESMAKGYFSINWERPAFMKIKVGSGVPYINVNQVLNSEGNWEREYLLSPFLKLTSIEEKSSITVEKTNGKALMSCYDVSLERQELPEISEDEEHTIEDELINSASEQYLRIMQIINSENEISQKKEFLHIQLQGQLSYLKEAENGQERSIARENVQEVRNQLEELDRVYEERIKENAELLSQVNNWKSKMRILCMSKCRKIEKLVDKQFEKEEEKFEIEKQEAAERRRLKFEEESKKTISKLLPQIEVNSKTNTQSVSEALEIQKEFKKIAVQMGVECFEYIKNPDELTKRLNELNEKTEELKSSVNSKIQSEEFYYYPYTVAEVVEKVSKQIQHINMPQPYEFTSKQTNALLKGISDRFATVKADADYSKLENELKTINQRGRFRKFFDKITGQEETKKSRANQIESMLTQIQKKKQDIARKKTLEPNRDYDEIEIFSDIELFIQENANNDLIKSHVDEIVQLRNKCYNVFNVEQDALQKTIQDKQKSLLPIQTDKKKSKSEKEYEKAQKFLIDNGYITEENNELDKYQVSDFATRIERVPVLQEKLARTIKQIIQDDVPVKTFIKECEERSIE